MSYKNIGAKIVGGRGFEQIGEANEKKMFAVVTRNHIFASP